MKFLKLQVQGFKCFDKPVTLNFTDMADAGLFLMTGVNNVDVELQANGAGKSSLLIDAPLWILYRRTGGGLQASGVNCWYGNVPTEGELTFSHAGETYTVRRTWRPNKLTLQHHPLPAKEVTQEELEEVIGISRNMMLYTVLLGQFGQMFLDLGATEALAVFTEILELGVWSNLSDRAKREAGALEDRVDALNRKIISTDAAKEQLEQSIQTHTLVSKEWEEKHKAELKVLAKRRRTAAAALKEAQQALDDQQDDSAALRTKVCALEEEIRNLRDFIDANMRKAQGYEAEQKHLRSDLFSIREDMEHIQKLGPTCDECGQEIAKEYKAAAYAKEKEKEKEVEEEFQALRVHLATLTDEKSLLVQEKDEMTDGLDVLKDKIEARVRARQSLETQVRLADHDLQTRIAGLATKRKEENPYATLIEKNMAELQTMEGRTTDLAVSLAALEAEHFSVKWWVSGYKEVRLYVVHQSLLQLEIEINNALGSLGMKDWAVRLDVARENKSGGVSKGFNTFVQSPHNDELVPWGSWSGGERQRLRIAGTIGISNLLKNMLGIDSEIEVWDEPTAHLSGKGIEDLLELMQQRAVECNKQVWLIDHRSLSSGYFNGVAVVQKDKEGSSLHTDAVSNNEEKVA